ncbi:MAG: endonuclease/exonuclease/phosphatase family protein [Gemmobacter sp.]
MKSRTVSFATFNLYNLNEPDLPMYTKATGHSAALVARKVAWSAAMLHRAQADVFGFQELWHAGPLERMFAEAGLAADYDLIVPPGQAGQRITCAGAVRKGMLDGTPEWIVDFPPAFRLESKGEDAQTPAIAVSVKRFSRPVLHFAVRPHEDRPAIHVLVCHFKSKGPTRIDAEPWYRADRALYGAHRSAIGAAISTVRRTAEALAARQIVTGLTRGSDTPVVVLGDLNDGQESNTLDILTEQPNYLQPLSTGGSDTALYAGQALQQLRSLRDVYFTYIHKRQHGSLDHILVSQELYDQSRKRVWKFDGLDIFNDHLNRDDLREIEGASDHGVVRACFSLRAAA